MRRTLALALLLAGCAQWPVAHDPTTPAPVASREVAARSDLLAYLAGLRGMGEAQLTAEAARQRRSGDDVGRVKAAMALSLAHADESEIVTLVEPVARREGPLELKAMAGFLQVMAAERRRLRESAAAAGARLRDERRAQEAMKQKADAAAERAAQLQQKLDALTEIERSLSDRPTNTR